MSGLSRHFFCFRARISENLIFEERIMIEFYLGDITTLKADAIVNAANNSLLGGGGVDGAIHRAAGPELLAECRTKKGCETGGVRLTRGYRLPASHVIHTVGPIFRDGKQNEPSLLASCYKESLKLALKEHFKSIIFPSISTGVYGYPLELAAPLALKTVLEFLHEHQDYDIKVTFCLFDKRTYEAYTEAYAKLQKAED